MSRPARASASAGWSRPAASQRGDNLRISFEVTDGKNDIPVRYQGIVPDLFREGQGVVAEGKLEPGGTFEADTVLAKHDERYMPKEVVDALKKAGRWQEGADTGASEMIPELGHYALVLALALGADPVGRAADRRAHATMPR